MTATALLTASKRLIIKIGSALVTDTENGNVKADWLESLAQDVKGLGDKEIIIVSSGAIALGRGPLGLDPCVYTRDLKVEQKQAAASIGQINLINTFQTCFQRNGLKISQVLLNSIDTEHRRTHLNARATLGTLLENGFIPVINENDTTATEEIRFSDNDKLAARVAQMMQADTLLILSTTDGLYTDNPFENPDAQHIGVIETITEDILGAARDTLTGISRGGMKSKIESAQIAVNAGTNVIITRGGENAPITRTLNGAQKATVFLAQSTPRTARKKWIAAHLKPKGCVMIDEGALKALKDGKSLLPVGVKDVQGEFKRGDAIEIKNAAAQLVAIGLSAYNAQDATIIKGRNSSELSTILGYHGRDVLIHRNDMVLMNEEDV